MATPARGVSVRASAVPSLFTVADNRRRAALPQWHRVVLTAVGVLAAAAATTFVVRTGGAATVSTDDAAPPTRTVVATSGPHTSAPAPAPVTVTMPGMPAETAVTLPPTTPAAAPMAQSTVDPRQVVYTVAGNQRPNDPITIVYADETGALRTVENVALPWRLTVVPDVPVNYVTANSAGSQLNCWITDASGKTVVSQTDYGTYTTCNR
jgi:hypothetical protein